MPKRLRLLVFIVADQAERTVKKVIRCIPASLAADYCALFLWVTDPFCLVPSISFRHWDCKNQSDRSGFDI